MHAYTPLSLSLSLLKEGIHRYTDKLKDNLKLAGMEIKTFENYASDRKLWKTKYILGINTNANTKLSHQANLCRTQTETAPSQPVTYESCCLVYESRGNTNIECRIKQIYDSCGESICVKILFLRSAG